MNQSTLRIIRNKIGLLNLAEELGNVSKACRMMGQRPRRTRNTMSSLATNYGSSRLWNSPGTIRVAVSAS